MDDLAISESAMRALAEQYSRARREQYARERREFHEQRFARLKNELDQLVQPTASERGLADLVATPWACAG